MYYVPIQFGKTRTKGNQTVWCVDAGRRHRSEHDTISFCFFGLVFGDVFGLHPINITSHIGLSNPIDIFYLFVFTFYSPFALVSSKPNLLLCKLLDGVSCVLGCLADPRATLSVSPRYVLLAYAQVF